jgi:dihydrolipoamide dehydrogenase
MRKGLETLCQKRKVLRVQGFGKLEGGGKVKVGQETYSAKSIVLATGSVPRCLESGIEDKSKVWTSEEALSLGRVPGSILILGAGPEGCEFALIFKGLGARVVLVEAKDRLLPGFDRDAGAALRRVLTAKGIAVRTGDKLAKATEAGQAIQAELASGQKETVEAILVCVGRLPNTKDMGFETAGIRLNEKKAILTNAFLQTNVDSVYAVGDVRGDLMMAHAASYEGYLTASRIAGQKESLDYRSVPSVVYTYPEVAEVGLNEEKAGEQNIPYEVGRFSFLALGRAHAKGQTEGFVKIIGHAKTQEILGGVIVGEGASDLVNMISLGIRKKLKVSDLRGHIAPHPSASEAVVEAAHLFFKEGLHHA